MKLRFRLNINIDYVFLPKQTFQIIKSLKNSLITSHTLIRAMLPSFSLDRHNN